RRRTAPPRFSFGLSTSQRLKLSTPQLCLSVSAFSVSASQRFNSSPTDSSPRYLVDSTHGYKSSWYSHPCALTVPAPSEYHTRSPTGASRTNAETCDTWPILRWPTLSPPSSPPIVANSLRRDAAATWHRPPAREFLSEPADDLLMW